KRRIAGVRARRTGPRRAAGLGGEDAVAPRRIRRTIQFRPAKERLASHGESREDSRTGEPTAYAAALNHTRQLTQLVRSGPEKSRNGLSQAESRLDSKSNLWHKPAPQRI